MLLSLFENNKDMHEIHVFILESGISDENKLRLTELAQSYSRDIHLIPMPDIEKLMGMSLFIANHISLSSFSRLFAASLLPESVDKILYMDGDIIVRGSLKEFWETDLTGFMLGGIHAHGGGAVKKSVFLKKEDPYIFAGLLLINLAEWRRQQIENHFICFAKAYNGKVPVEDMGIINGVLSRHVKLCHPKYNFTWKYLKHDYEELKRRWGYEAYREETIREAKENPVIFHYVAADKPWHKGYDGPYRDEFLHYKSISAWADTPLQESFLQKQTNDDAEKKTGQKAKLKALLPRPLFIWLIKNILPIWRYFRLRNSMKHVKPIVCQRQDQ
jgi:lipopolysaccharide biosynthesis glycosyltransferase